jgi:hypothetical protein
MLLALFASPLSTLLNIQFALF